jgi:hypothetical protein
VRIRSKPPVQIMRPVETDTMRSTKRAKLDICLLSKAFGNLGN